MMPLSRLLTTAAVVGSMIAAGVVAVGDRQQPRPPTTPITLPGDGEGSAAREQPVSTERDDESRRPRTRPRRADLPEPRRASPAGSSTKTQDAVDRATAPAPAQVRDDDDDTDTDSEDEEDEEDDDDDEDED